MRRVIRYLIQALLRRAVKGVAPRRTVAAHRPVDEPPAAAPLKPFKIRCVAGFEAQVVEVQAYSLAHAAEGLVKALAAVRVDAGCCRGREVCSVERPMSLPSMPAWAEILREQRLTVLLKGKGVKRALLEVEEEPALEISMKDFTGDSEWICEESKEAFDD